LSSEAVVRPRRRINLGLDKYSGIYVWVILVVVFGFWVPDLFLSVQTLQSVLSNEAVTSLVALAFMVPIAAGVFDLSVAAMISLSGSMMAILLLDHRGIWVSAGAALLAGVLVGLANAFVIVRLKVDSFIATLGMTSILTAIAFYITNSQQKSLPQDGFQPFLDFGRNTILGLPMPVYYTAIIALIIWWVLEYTPAGRYLYAVGGNPVATRLAGVRTGKVVMFALIASGFLGALAGIILTARLGVATPDMGNPYLLPAFSAVFLGATQIRPGRVNVLGTIVAILLLATGVKGLQLVGAPGQVTDLFNGLALIIAVALASRTARSRA
jgi:ribose transport system permease protein